MDSQSLVFLGCAALAWSAAIYKASALRRRREAAVWALVAAIAFPATAFTVAAPVIYRALDRLTGVANLATLVVYMCIVAYSVTALVMLLLWHLPAVEARRRSRRLLVAYGIVLATMVALFTSANVPADHPGTFEDAYGTRPVVGALILVYVVAFAVALTALVWRGFTFAHRVARTGGHPWLARGLHAVAIGSAITVGYCIALAGYVIAGWLGVRRPDLVPLGIMCACVGAVLVTTGFTTPTWGAHLSTLHHRLHLAAAYLRLWPLWHMLYTAAPAIALDPPRSRWADLLALRDLDYRLYRRIIEIRDGQLALAPYADLAPPLQQSAQHRGAPTAAVHQAHRLRHAARTLIAGQVQRSTEAVTHSPDASSSASPAEELDWLLQLSTALRQLPSELDSSHHRTSQEPAC